MDQIFQVISYWLIDWLIDRSIDWLGLTSFDSNKQCWHITEEGNSKSIYNGCKTWLNPHAEIATQVADISTRRRAAILINVAVAEFNPNLAKLYCPKTEKEESGKMAIT